VREGSVREREGWRVRSEGQYCMSGAWQAWPALYCHKAWGEVVGSRWAAGAPRKRDSCCCTRQPHKPSGTHTCCGGVYKQQQQCCGVHCTEQSNAQIPLVLYPLPAAPASPPTVEKLHLGAGRAGEAQAEAVGSAQRAEQQDSWETGVRGVPETTVPASLRQQGVRTRRGPCDECDCHASVEYGVLLFWPAAHHKLLEANVQGGTGGRAPWWVRGPGKR